MYIMPQLKNKKNKMRYVEQYRACNIIHFFALNEKRICLFYLFLFFSSNRPDYLQERSVFSELISQRPKRQELPEIAPQVDEENVDTG